ncbi:MAG: transposase [Gammaproteobacteria bacterium]|nr:transposase [Gammaproteobacteria bacterium]
MNNATLSDDNWNRILAFLREEETIYIGTVQSCRQFAEAVLWMLRSGAQ